MNRQKANLAILERLYEYIVQNPDQRFGQILRNTGIVLDTRAKFGDNVENIWVNGFYEESDSVLKRMDNYE